MQHLRRLSGAWGCRVALLAILAAFSLPLVAHARAGGGHSYSGGGGSYGGGGSHSSGRSGGGGEAILIYYWIRFVIAYPQIGVPATLVVVYVLYLGGNKGHSYHVGRTIRRGAATQLSTDMNASLLKLKARDRAFSENPFLERVRGAFLKIQSSWSGQDMSPSRAFISDGVMERFSIQIDMQKALGLRNDMSAVRVIESRISQADSDEHFDTLHVAIRASAVDTDVSLTDGSILRNAGKRTEEFTEVWSFLRRPGAKTLIKPGLIEGHCPNCGSPLEIGQTAKCGACGSLVNSGEYDWVLAEITQAEEWTPRHPERAIAGFLDMKRADPALSAQFIEDRTSVAFWRWQAARWENTGESLGSVATPECVQALTKEQRELKTFYKDAAVGCVEVLACERGTPFDRVHAMVRWSGEKHALEEGKAVSKGQALLAHVFILIRKSGTATDAKAGLRSAACAGCGAPPSDRRAAACEYCGAVFADGSKSWAVSAIVPRILWQKPAVPVAAPAAAADAAEPADGWADGLAPAQGLAILVAAMAMDGRVDPREMTFAKEYAKKHAIPDKKIDAMISAVRAGQLQVPHPKSPAQAKAYLSGLIRMSLADGSISGAEMKSLLAFGKRLKLEPSVVENMATVERREMYARARTSLKEAA